jgi:precorrin-6B methylase 1
LRKSAVSAKLQFIISALQLLSRKLEFRIKEALFFFVHNAKVFTLKNSQKHSKNVIKN